MNIEGNTEHNSPEHSTSPIKGHGEESGGTAGKGRSKAGRQSGEPVKTTPQAAAEITLHTLLEAGAHFGHQTSRWSPAMAPYIHTARNGIHIINLPKTVQSWNSAKKVIHDVVARGGNVLFVGTKKQAQDAVVDEARRAGAFFVSRRWLGGMLTNFQTVRKSIERMNKLGQMLAEEDTTIASGGTPKFTKKERLMMSREREKLEFSLGGIKEMHGAPQMLFVIDIKREEIAVKEARRLDIPVVALVDTNCDPKTVNYPIPSNDDGTRAIRLFCQAVADTIIEGKQVAVERRVADSLEARRSRTEARGGAESAKDSSVEAPAAEAPAAPVEETKPESETPL